MTDSPARERDILGLVPSGVHRLQSGPYLRFALAEFADVGISEHTVKVCAMPPRTIESLDSFIPISDRSIASVVRARRIVRQQPEVRHGERTCHGHLSRPGSWPGKGVVLGGFSTATVLDQPFYVGFSIAGYELGLDPNASVNRAGRGGSVAYWRVDDIERAVQHFTASG